MSVINQVLSQLEQRGIHDESGQIRPISVVKKDRKNQLWIVFAVIVSILLGIILGSWLSHRTTKTPVVTTVTPVATSPILIASGITANTPAITTPVSSVVSAVIVPAMPEPSAILTAPPLPPQLAHVVIDTKPVNPAKPLHAAHPDKPLPQQIAALPDQSPSLPVVAPVLLPEKKISMTQQAEAEFHQATVAMQQGHLAEALAGLEAVLNLEPKHEAARQTLVALLLENKRSEDAERVLHVGLQQNPQQLTFIMLLARLQVDRGALSEGLQTLEVGLPYAKEQAEYLAFFAALLQRQARHAEAVTYYQNALQQHPNHGIWLMGMGISLQALQRNIEAKEVFQRALNSHTLTPSLQKFVQQRIKEL
ncbi:MAG: tetratricopeptide repeat protein [Gallionella sp.]|nr:tetratricopeptide repeat protein [Gallionella sp.]MDD4960106.1 tetratricopeptide repeat protein [Gallionella sp.]